jgi:hypothetical protein
LERRLCNGALTLRAGYGWTRGATEPGHPHPALLDLDRHTLAVGVASHVDWLMLGLAVSHSVESQLDAPNRANGIETPLDPELAIEAGKGIYGTNRTTAVLEAQAQW